MKLKLFIFDVSGTLKDGFGGLFPNLKEVLQTLYGQGATLAVASSLSVGAIRRFLSEQGVEELFSVIKSADQTQPKPHPLMLQEIILESGCDKSETVMIGDSREDLEMAKAAGVLSAVALWRGDLTTHQFMDLQPNFVLQLVGEISSLLQQK